ncbi:MAG TPA: hypothetical protein VF725_00850, partial [Ktedonobacterales bacterium]
MNARRAGSWMGAQWARGAIVVVALLTLAGCSLGGGGNGSGGSNPLSSNQNLNALAWCDQPLISFQDDSQQSQ